MSCKWSYLQKRIACSGWWVDWGIKREPSRFDSRQGQKGFLYIKLGRLLVGPTQLPVGWVPWAPSPRVKRESDLFLRSWDRASLIVFKHNQQDATLHNDIYYYKCSTCFRRFLRPSSGAQKLYTQQRVFVELLLFLTACSASGKKQ